MIQTLFRFVIGGVVVSVFAALADTLKPKSFAGLFGAAPSVALATLGLAVATNGASYAALEARSMVVGAAALLIYAAVCCRVMFKRFHAAPTTISALGLWLAIAIGLWALILR